MDRPLAASPAAATPASPARLDRVAAPILRVDISQGLGEDPPMAERIDEASLTFAVFPVVRGLLRVGACGTSSIKHGVDVVDPKHHLLSRPGYTFIYSVLAHDHLGALAVDAELHAMGLADTDVFDQPQHIRVPGDRFAYVGYS
jgi:hypothetical protein